MDSNFEQNNSDSKWNVSNFKRNNINLEFQIELLFPIKEINVSWDS